MVIILLSFTGTTRMGMCGMTWERMMLSTHQKELNTFSKALNSFKAALVCPLVLIFFFNFNFFLRDGEPFLPTKLSYYGI